MEFIKYGTYVPKFRCVYYFYSWFRNVVCIRTLWGHAESNPNRTERMTFPNMWNYVVTQWLLFGHLFDPYVIKLHPQLAFNARIIITLCTRHLKVFENRRCTNIGNHRIIALSSVNITLDHPVYHNNNICIYDYYQINI